MRILIDYTAALKQGGGIGRITRGLVLGAAEHSPQDEFMLLAARDAPAVTFTAPNISLHRFPLDERALAVAWHRLRLPLPVEQLAWCSGEVFHAPNFTLPPSRAPRRIVTIHDLTFLRYPDGAVPSLRRFLTQAVPRSVRHATHVIADSQATKEDLVDWLRIAPEKVTVVYAGVDQRFQPVTDEAERAAVRKKYGLVRPFILGLGTLEPRKNFAGLIRAFARARLSEHELVIAGRQGWLFEPIVAAARETPNVRLIGFVDDADLPALYSLASAYCLPSFYEGFGIPTIEAMACGTPVVCSDQPCLPEIVGDAALLCPPTDIDALAAALAQVVNAADLRQTLIERGYARAREFPWARGVRALLGVYEHEPATGSRA